MGYPLRQRRKRLLVAASLWAALLLVLSVQPDRIVEIFIKSEPMSLMAHVAAYGIFSFVLCLYFRFLRSLGSLRLTDLWVFVLSWALSTAWGGMIELIHMGLPERYATWTDFGANALGAALGLAAFAAFRASTLCVRLGLR